MSAAGRHSVYAHEWAGLDLPPADPWHGRSFAFRLRGPTERETRDLAVTASCLRRRDNILPAQVVTPAAYTDTRIHVPIGPEGEICLYERTAAPIAEMQSWPVRRSREMQEGLKAHLGWVGRA